MWTHVHASCGLFECSAAQPGEVFVLGHVARDIGSEAGKTDVKKAGGLGSLRICARFQVLFSGMCSEGELWGEFVA